MEFKDLIRRAKDGDKAAAEDLLALYTPLLSKEAMVNGGFDEDLYQELCLTFINCLKKFKL